MSLFLIYYLIAINVIGSIICWDDKRRAQKNVWRIPEKTIFGIAFLGGGWGVWLGMYLFRHKTKHWYFVWGIPLISLVEYGLLTWMLFRYGSI